MVVKQTFACKQSGQFVKCVDVFSLQLSATGKHIICKTIYNIASEIHVVIISLECILNVFPPVVVNF